MKDLREYINLLEARDQLVRIDHRVSPRLEITRLQIASANLRQRPTKLYYLRKKIGKKSRIEGEDIFRTIAETTSQKERQEGPVGNKE